MYDPHQPEQWSGTNSYIHRALAQQGIQIVDIGPLGVPWSLPSKARKLVYRLLGRQFLRDRQPGVARAYAAQVEKTLRQAAVELVFSPGTREIAALSTRLPVAFWTDATFAGMVDVNPDFTRLCAESLRNGHALEQAALERCWLAL
ncbi:MAG: group 1 glycosyl transferase, partial [Chloroflexota bacterium]